MSYTLVGQPGWRAIWVKENWILHSSRIVATENEAKLIVKQWREQLDHTEDYRVERVLFAPQINDPQLSASASSLLEENELLRAWVVAYAWELRRDAILSAIATAESFKASPGLIHDLNKLL